MSLRKHVEEGDIFYADFTPKMRTGEKLTSPDVTVSSSPATEGGPWVDLTSAFVDESFAPKIGTLSGNDFTENVNGGVVAYALKPEAAAGAQPPTRENRPHAVKVSVDGSIGGPYVIVDDLIVSAKGRV